MRQGNNGRRPRGGRPNRRPGPLKAQTFDSNGPDVRIRGNAHQVYEKYLALARDSTAGGDRVLAESYWQFAEHYYRIIHESTDPESPGSHRPHFRDPRYEEWDGEDEGYGDSAPPNPQGNGGRDNGNREGREGGQHRDGNRDNGREGYQGRDQGGRDQGGRDQRDRDQGGRDHQGNRDQGNRDQGNRDHQGNREHQGNRDYQGSRDHQGNRDRDRDRGQPRDYQQGSRRDQGYQGQGYQGAPQGGPDVTPQAPQPAPAPAVEPVATPAVQPTPVPIQVAQPLPVQQPLPMVEAEAAAEPRRPGRRAATESSDEDRAGLERTLGGRAPRRAAAAPVEAAPPAEAAEASEAPAQPLGRGRLRRRSKAEDGEAAPSRRAFPPRAEAGGAEAGAEPPAPAAGETATGGSES